MKIQVSKKDFRIRPFGLIVRFGDEQVCIPKSFVLNRETARTVETLDIEDWFYRVHIEPYDLRSESPV